MFGVESLRWLRSAVNEVKTTRREQKSEEKIRRGGEKKNEGKRRKKDSWPGCRTYCITAVFNKRHSSIDLRRGNFSKHPVELKRPMGSPCCSD